MTDEIKDRPATNPTCERCDKPYVRRKPWQKYCGAECRRAINKIISQDGLAVTVGRLSTRKSGCLSLTVLIQKADGERAIKLFGAQGAQARIALEPAAGLDP